MRFLPVAHFSVAHFSVAQISVALFSVALFTVNHMFVHLTHDIGYASLDKCLKYAHRTNVALWRIFRIKLFVRTSCTCI